MLYIYARTRTQVATSMSDTVPKVSQPLSNNCTNAIPKLSQTCPQTWPTTWMKNSLLPSVIKRPPAPTYFWLGF